MKQNGFSLVELLVITAIVAILAGILFPVFREAGRARADNASNLQKLTAAASHYGSDYDNRLPIMINGTYRNMKNVKDGVLTIYGERRTDAWPLLLVPYLDSRTTLVDPKRTDPNNIWSGPPLAPGDPGYVPTANTFRNQNRMPFFGVNYLFLSPLKIAVDKMSDAVPTDYVIGVSHAAYEAENLPNTVFFTPSFYGRAPQSAADDIGVPDFSRGHYGVNAPGMWGHLVASSSPYLVFWTGTDCGGDWCGEDIDPKTSGVQTSESCFYKDPANQGNNVAFLDGHVDFMTATALAAGTDYLTASPQAFGTGFRGGGAEITDKSQYLWNLDVNYYGA